MAEYPEAEFFKEFSDAQNIIWNVSSNKMMLIV